MPILVVVIVVGCILLALNIWAGILVLIAGMYPMYRIHLEKQKNVKAVIKYHFVVAIPDYKLRCDVIDTEGFILFWLNRVNPKHPKLYGNNLGAWRFAYPLTEKDQLEFERVLHEKGLSSFEIERLFIQTPFFYVEDKTIESIEENITS